MASVEDVYRKYGFQVFRRCLRIVRVEAEAEDLTHEVFVRALTAGPRPALPDDEQEAMAWLYRVATNLCLNRLRDRARRERDAWQMEVRAVTAGAGDDVFAGASGPEREVIERQLVCALVSELDEESAALAVYYWVDGMSQTEIANVVGLARGTVNRKLGELARMLRARFGEALA